MTNGRESAVPCAAALGWSTRELPTALHADYGAAGAQVALFSVQD